MAILMKSEGLPLVPMAVHHLPQSKHFRMGEGETPNRCHAKNSRDFEKGKFMRPAEQIKIQIDFLKMVLEKRNYSRSTCKVAFGALQVLEWVVEQSAVAPVLLLDMHEEVVRTNPKV